MQFKASMGKQVLFCKKDHEEQARKEEEPSTYAKFVSGHDEVKTKRARSERKRDAKSSKKVRSTNPAGELSNFETHEVAEKQQKNEKKEDARTSSSSSSSSSDSSSDGNSPIGENAPGIADLNEALKRV